MIQRAGVGLKDVVVAVAIVAQILCRSHRTFHISSTELSCILSSSMVDRLQGELLESDIDRPHGVIEDMVALAQPSYVLSSQERSKCCKFAMASKHFLIESAKALLRKACGTACLCWYSNDTTPMMARRSFRTVGGQLSFISRARQSGEYVVQRFFFHAASGDSATVLVEPQRVKDKTAATHSELYRNLFYQLARAWCDRLQCFFLSCG